MGVKFVCVECPRIFLQAGVEYPDILYACVECSRIFCMRV